MEKRKPSPTQWQCKLLQPRWRTVCSFPKKLKIELLCGAAIPLLGIYLEKTIIEKDTCDSMFVTATFTVARTWKQLRCPLTDERIKKLWNKYTINYYLAIKRNTFELVVVRWINLEPVIQSEVSQKEIYFIY